MQQREWTEILSMRWFWGFFAFYFLGWKSKNTLRSTQFPFIPLTAVLFICFISTRKDDFWKNYHA